MAPTTGKKKPKKGGKTSKSVLSLKEKSLSKLRAAGFRRVPGIADQTFTFENQMTDIDDVFVFENVFVVAEYTCSQSSDVGGI